MADIQEVNGVFGGVELGTIGVENNGVGYAGGVNDAGAIANVGSNLPAKTGFWNKFKAVMFQEINWKHEIKVVLTPKQQKIEDEINEFLHQEITWEKVHDFLFQDISFGRKKA